MTIFGSIILNRLRIEPVLPFSHSILHARNPSFIASLPPSTIYSTDFALLAFIQHSTPPQSNSKTKRKENAGEGDRTISSPLQPGCNLALQTAQLTWLPKFFLSFNFSLVFMRRPIFPLAVWPYRNLAVQLSYIKFRVLPAQNPQTKKTLNILCE